MISVTNIHALVEGVVCDAAKVLGAPLLEYQARRARSPRPQLRDDFDQLADERLVVVARVALWYGRLRSQLVDGQLQ